MREYKIVRNLPLVFSRNLSRKLDKVHQLEIAKSCKTNPKCFWKHVREKTGVRSGIPNLKIKGGTETILCEDIDKANALVNQFSSVFTMEPGDEFTAFSLPDLARPTTNLLQAHLCCTRRLM